MVGALRGAGLHVEQAQPVAAANHVVGIHRKPPQGVDAGLADFVGGNFGNDERLDAEMRQRHGRVRFRPRVAHGKLLRLHQTVIPSGTETQQQLSESHNATS